jgi:hypothetical protein
VNGIETDIVNAVTGLLSLSVTALVGYLAPKVKKIVDAHTSASHAQVFNHVVDGLGRIAEATVMDFNQRVVNDAKEQGVFTPALAQSIKSDAMDAVKTQGSALISLAGESISDVDPFVSSLIEHAIAKQKTKQTHTMPEAACTAS